MISRAEKYWIFAILWLFLAERDPSQDATWQIVISLACFALAIGYFIAMCWAAFTDRKR